MRRDVNIFDALFAAAFAVLFALTIAGSWAWPFGARLVPQVIGWTGLIASVILLVLQFLLKFEDTSARTAAAGGLHFDTTGELQGLAPQTIARRALVYFGWLLFFLGAAALVGLLPAMALFLAGYLRFGAKENVVTALAIAAVVTTLSYFLFHWLLIVPWPSALIGDLVPELRSIRALRLF